MHFRHALLLPLLPLATAHFLLNSPPTIGFSDDDEGDYPCGSFDATSRKTVTDFPTGGLPISLTSTHPEVTWFYRAALLNDTNTWVDLSQAIDQVGQGNFCSQNVPGLAAWEGKDAVLQIAASAPDGWLFQCSAVKFVSGGATAPGAGCKNATSVKASFSNEKLTLNAQTTSVSASSSQPTETGASAAAPSASTTSAPKTNAAVSNSAGRLAVLGSVIGVIGFLLAL
ncbi:hypothetical protein ABW21_db0207719 [Orbilia brochopaga]|nr:hypothetical protein ABW21_db0207719 [Drechslerella brochopaga]